MDACTINPAYMPFFGTNLDPGFISGDFSKAELGCGIRHFVQEFHLFVQIELYQDFSFQAWRIPQIQSFYGHKEWGVFFPKEVGGWAAGRGGGGRLDAIGYGLQSLQGVLFGFFQGLLHFPLIAILFSHPGTLGIGPDQEADKKDQNGQELDAKKQILSVLAHVIRGLTSNLVILTVDVPSLSSSEM